MKIKDKLLNLKDYLILIVCLILFFVLGFYFLSGGYFPNDFKTMYLWIFGITISIPVTIYALKKLSD